MKLKAFLGSYLQIIRLYAILCPSYSFIVWSISGRFGSNLANLGGCLVLIEMKSENTLVLISGVCPIGTLGEIEILGKIVFWQTLTDVNF